MKKLLFLSLMLSLWLATVTPALNAVAESQQDAVAQSQANPAHVSGWQAAKKWWQSGRNMKALSKQEKKAFRALKRRFTIGAIIAAIVAMIGGGVKYRQHRSEQERKAQKDFDALFEAKPSDIRAEYKDFDAIFYESDDKKHKIQDLFDAINTNDIVGVTQALKKVGVNDRHYDVTPLMAAAKQGYYNIVDLLIKKGANVNARDSHGWTALKRVSNILMDEENPLSYHNIIKLLIKNGADVNLQGSDGVTALMDAAWGGDVTLARILLEAGANKNLENKKQTLGKTAEEMALRRDSQGSREVARLIQGWQGN